MRNIDVLKTDENKLKSLIVDLFISEDVTETFSYASFCKKCPCKNMCENTHENVTCSEMFTRWFESYVLKNDENELKSLIIDFLNNSYGSFCKECPCRNMCKSIHEDMECSEVFMRWLEQEVKS